MNVTGFYDKDSTVYYPYDLDGAKAELEKAGLTDSDGDGFVNFPERRQRRGDPARQRRLRHRQEPRRGHHRDDGAARRSGHSEHPVGQRQRSRRCRLGSSTGCFAATTPELVTVVQNTDAARAGRPADSSAATAPTIEGEIDLLDFEKQMVADHQHVHQHRRQRQASAGDEGVPEDLHRERLRYRADCLSRAR